MSSVAVAQSDDIWRRRLGCLAYVDDMIGTLFDQLEQACAREVEVRAGARASS